MMMMMMVSMIRCCRFMRTRRKSSMKIGCLVVLLLGALVGAADNDAVDVGEIVIHAEAASNLTVVPVVTHSPKELQLNVSWIPPNGDPFPESYSVEVISQNSTRNCVSRPCDDRVNSSLSWKLIPPDIAVIDGSECSIRPGCTYFVTLKSHPFNGKNRIRTHITIPECVEHVCTCKVPSTLPRPMVDVQLKNNSANITWHFGRLPEGVQISHYKIKFGAQTVTTAHSKPWFGNDQLFEVPWSGRALEWKQVTVGDHKNRTYHVWVHLVDSRGCEGPAGNRTFTFKSDVQSAPVSELRAIHIIFIVFGVLSTVSLIIVLVVKWKAPNTTPCCLKQLLAVVRRGEQNITRQTAWPPPSSRYPVDGNGFAMTANGLKYEEICPLYVEKEIEEARLRGDVDEWEISADRVKMGPMIGEGAFGRVYIARLESAGQPIAAVKKLKDTACADEVREFLSEIAMLKLVGKHRHVVALIGCCTMRQPYYAILEYAERGELLAHLRKLRELYMRLTNSPSYRSSVTSSLAQALRKPGARPSLAETEYTTLESVSSRFGGGIRAGAPIGGAHPSDGKYVPNNNAALRCSITDASLATLDNNSLSLATSLRSVDGGAALRPGVVVLASDVTGASLDSDAFGSTLSSEGGGVGDALAAGGRFRAVHSPELVLDARELHAYALQIAKGMQHLENVGITHRDLAARNILIDSEGMLKISDLGLSRPGVYVNRNRNKVPLRWLAIEAIRSSCYSSKSDVWSFAVVLWEIGTLGGHPYPTLNDHQIVGYLVEGERLDRPPIVSPELYATMRRCWSDDPRARPSFGELVRLLDADEAKSKTYIDIGAIRSSLTFPPTEETTTTTHVKDDNSNRTLLSGNKNVC